MGSLFSFWQRMFFVDILKRNSMICGHLKSTKQEVHNNLDEPIFKN